MRNTAKFFALLDLISIMLLSKQVWEIITHFNQIPHQLLSQIKVGILIPVYLSLFLSAIGLFRFSKTGWITYYIQFPLRLIVWVFSIGFITYLPEVFNMSEKWFYALLRICFVAEFFRLYFTIRMHRLAFRDNY